MSKRSRPSRWFFLLTLAAATWAGPVDDLDAWLKLDRKTRPSLETRPFADVPLARAESDLARALIWADRTAYVKSEWGAQWTARKLADGNGFQMPFDYRIYGGKPAAGYDLYISMHGGGETTQAENDSQWRNQIILYHPNGIYLAPRAPTDAWNMWHKDHIDAFFDRLIQLCVANLGANPDRVYLMGYSAGGDGVYQMAPRMADRWAAAAMMAGYPNHASPINLRNIGYTMHVGALDASYGRNTIAVTYGQEIQKLQDADPGFYEYSVQVHAGKPHWMDLEDTVALDWMDDFTRHPRPSKVIWRQDTTVGTNSFPSGGAVKPVRGHPTQYRFHWIGLPERTPPPAQAGLPAFQANVTASIQGQEIRILESNVDSLRFYLDDSLIDLDRPVRVLWKGVPVYSGTPPRTIANLYATAQDRGDLAYTDPVALDAGRNGLVSLGFHRKQERFRVTAAQGRVKAAFAGGWVSGRIRLSDLSGALIREAAFRDRTEAILPAGDVPPGLYLVSVTLAERRFAAPIFIP